MSGSSRIYKTPAAFDAACRRAWGRVLPNTRQLLRKSLPSLWSFWKFEGERDLVKAHVAHMLILQTTPRVQSYFDPGHARPFLHYFAMDMIWARGLFDADRTGNLRAALLLAAMARPRAMGKATEEDYILGGGSALAVTYMIPQLEYIFRVLSSYISA